MIDKLFLKRPLVRSVATSPLALRWMRAKNNTHIYVARTSNNRVIVACNLW